MRLLYCLLKKDIKILGLVIWTSCPRDSLLDQYDQYNQLHHIPPQLLQDGVPHEAPLPLPLPLHCVLAGHVAFLCLTGNQLVNYHLQIMT